MIAARPLFAGVMTSAVVIAFTVMAGMFASSQSIWVDETTQLSGLALPFGEQFRWLVGRSELQLGVPPDRMPPLSYWAGALWAALFGLSETTMRWFGIAATTAAAPALYLAGRMRGGMSGGLFVVAVVLFSPNTLVMAGEIRAYPLFLTFSAWSVWAFLRCLDPAIGNRPGRLAALSVLLVLTAYTHFFGIVLAGAVLATLLVERILSGAGIRPILVAVLCSTVALAGLLPFVLSAVTVSGDGGAATGTSLREVAAEGARLVYRLFLHGTHSVYLGVFLATGLGLIGLAIMSLAGSRHRFDADASRARHPAFVLLPLALAGVALPLLDLRIGSFAVLAPHYNLWMVPLAAVFLAGAFAPAPGRSWYPRIAQVFGIVAIAGHLAAGAILLRHAPLYSHGPGDWLAERWAETTHPTIVHDGTGLWGHAYFPLHYLSGGDAVQLLARNDGTLWRILPVGLEPVADPTTYLSTLGHVLRVRVEDMNSGELALIVRGEAPCEPQPPAGADPASLEYFCAYAAAAVSAMAEPSQ